MKANNLQKVLRDMAASCSHNTKIQLPVCNNKTITKRYKEMIEPSLLRVKETWEREFPGHLYLK